MGSQYSRRSLAVLLRDYNLAAVARAVGVAPSTIYRWRDGSAKPTSEGLQKIAQFLGVDANDIRLARDDTTHIRKPS